MRLNSDCVRDILLTAEDSCDYNSSMNYNKDDSHMIRLVKYTHEEIIYHIKQCELSSLILNIHYYDGGDHITIGDLSPEGHKFIANIREETVWNGVKSIAKKIGSTSLSAITQIASNVVTELIKAQFNLA